MWAIRSVRRTTAWHPRWRYSQRTCRFRMISRSGSTFSRSPGVRGWQPWGQEPWRTTQGRMHPEQYRWPQAARTGLSSTPPHTPHFLSSVIPLTNLSASKPMVGDRGVVAVTTEKLQGHLRAEARGTAAAEEGVFGCLFFYETSR